MRMISGTVEITTQEGPLILNNRKTTFPSMEVFYFKYETKIRLLFSISREKHRRKSQRKSNFIRNTFSLYKTPPYKLRRSTEYCPNK